MEHGNSKIQELRYVGEDGGKGQTGICFCHEMVTWAKNSAQECLSECCGGVPKFCDFLVVFPLVLDYSGKLGKVEVILNQRLLEGGAGRSSPALLRSSSWASNSTTAFSTSSFTVLSCIVARGLMGTGRRSPLSWPSPQDKMDGR